MGKSELQSAYAGWSKRVAKYESAGIPTQVWEPLAKQDLTKTFSQGSAPMTNAEADVAVYSAWKGQNAIHTEPAHHHGIFGALESIAGSIIPDIGNVITSLPRGVAEFGKELVTPSEWVKAGQDIGKAAGDIGSGQFGQAARDVAGSHLLSAIPGVADLADLTTAQGRQHLLTHPVSAALDVLPETRLASKGVGAALGKAGVEGAGVDALRAGRPVKGALLQADASLAGGRGAAAVARAIDKAKLSERNKNLSSALNRQGLASGAELERFTSQKVESLLAPLKGDINAELEFSKKAAVGDIESMSPEERTVYNDIKTEQMKLQDQEYLAKNKLQQTPEGWLYPSDSRVMKLHRARDRHAARLDKAHVNISRAQERVDQATHRQAVAVAGAQRVLALIQSKKGKVSSGEREKILRSLARANTEAVRAKASLAKASNTLEGTRSAVTKVNEDLQKAIIRDPPQHLHEVIKQDFRKRVAQAYTDKTFPDGIPIKGAQESTILSEYNKVARDIETNPVMDSFYSYIGKEETKALLHDSVQEALRLSKEGLAPLYFHTVREPDLARVTSMHIARTKDVAEAQIKRKAFNIETSVLNIRANLTAEMRNIIRRDGMQQVYEKALVPHQQTLKELLPTYMSAAEALLKSGKRRGVTVGHLAMVELEKEWSKFSFSQYGIQRPGTVAKGEDIYIPKTMADNLATFEEGTRVDPLLQSRAYQGAMKVFRTSVLYGPRHFAHVVIGGIMPMMLDDPFALTEFPKLWELFKTVSRGKTFDGKVNGVELPPEITTHFSYKTDFTDKVVQTKIGNKYAEMLHDFWAKTGAKPGEKLAHVENAAQSLYQAAVYMRDVGKGVDPMVAIEHARKLVVNMDEMSPFERTILKQVFPFYSFTRFAVKFLVHLPFDHPLRVSILSSISNQAQEEWGTGLPQKMMQLFFIGHPDVNGNINTINFRNMNPFRSVPSMFTLAGFMSSLNPLVTAPFVAAGFNPLSGTSSMYPEIGYDPVSGNLTVQRPKGGMMLAAEQFVPELGGIDAMLGISDNMRRLRATDRGAFDRQIMNMFNIPFQWSKYNIPQVIGKNAEHAYIGARNALSQYKKTGDYESTIGKFSFVPFNGALIPSTQFRAYWEQMQQYQKQHYPGAATTAVIPKPATGTSSNVLSELINTYGGNQ